MVKDEKQITRMNWVREERREVSFHCRRKPIASRFWEHLRPGSLANPIKGREMELVFTEPFPRAGVM